MQEALSCKVSPRPWPQQWAPPVPAVGSSGSSSGLLLEEGSDYSQPEGDAGPLAKQAERAGGPSRR